MDRTTNVSLSSMAAETVKNRPFLPWDNPDNVVSARTEAIMQKVVGCGATEVVMILGIPGNIISMAVFVRQGLKDRITLMLLCLATADLLNLLCYFSMNISCFVQPVDPVLAANIQTLQYSQVIYLNLMAGFLSVSLVTVLSVDRCLAITLPLQAARILTFRRTVIIIVTVSAITIGMFIPSLWLNAVAWITDPVSNRAKAKLVPTQFALQHPLYGNIFRTYRIVTKTVCLVAVLISCSITVTTLRAASKLRAKMAESTKVPPQSDVQITVMLLFVCVVMVFCLIPDLMFMISHLLVRDFFMFRKYHNIFLVVHYFIFFSQCLNSAANFYLYLLLSSKFRVTLKELLPCKRQSS